MQPQKLQQFQELVWDFYSNHARQLPWREPPFDAYNVLVSEIMLQQTQVTRVIPKYHEFLARFPDISTLAAAPLAEVLKAWNGLGYNRRARYLHEAAKYLASQKQAWKIDDLISCKGIGHNTAAAVITYAYNQPLPFIETNIRTVYIHHFFADSTDISDKQLLPLVEATLDREHPREFMWAIMDYGSYLKQTVGNVARNSKHYSKQSKFQGSKRQIRGQVLRLLHDKHLRIEQIEAAISDSRLAEVLGDLEAEKLISRRGKTIGLYR